MLRSMRRRSPWTRLRHAAILLGVAILLPLAPAGAFAVLPGPLGDPATFALGLGLVGALEVAFAVNPAPGRGRAPDLR